MISADVILREPMSTDVPNYHWLNDPDVTRFMDKGYGPHCYDDQIEYLDKMRSSATDILWAIQVGGDHIGNVGLHKINRQHRSAEIGILIGDRNARGNGYGKQAWRLACRHGFSVLGLNRIYCWIMVGNIASQKCAEACGFGCVGMVPQMFFKRGGWIDGALFNCRAEKFRDELK